MKYFSLYIFICFLRAYFSSQSNFIISETINDAFSCTKKANSNINLGKWTISDKLGPPNTFDMTNCKSSCLV